MSSLIPKNPFFFFRTLNSEKKKSASSGIPPYSRRALIAVIIAIPMAFGLNMPLNSMVLFLPTEGIIMINAIIIPSYMTFMMPKASKLFSSWLNQTKANQDRQNLYKSQKN